MADSDFSPIERKSKVIDAKLPLVWLLGTAVSIISSYAILYSDVARLRTDVADLKVTLKSSDSTLIGLQGQMAILQYRTDLLEKARAAKEAKEGMR